MHMNAGRLTAGRAALLRLGPSPWPALEVVRLQLEPSDEVFILRSLNTCRAFTLCALAFEQSHTHSLHMHL